ncbi:hypothetical protein CK203_102124 [Vitis vinifera]|uniref:ATP synthase mitochondrial F1 complex assembly factor 2 n=1 Tax=Vitis vinifera TaxID=29760 RepID=A0A438CR49_VITVI|nr:hypothetical protein CK203_102124 [Vitis vinifera]
MASAVMKKTLNSIKNPLILRGLSSQTLRFSAVATASNPESEGASSSFTFNEKNSDKDDSIHVKGPSSNPRRETTSVTMPMSFMTGSIVGKRFYKQASTREADDGNGWTVMLDYRTLKTPSKRPLKLPTLSLAKAIAAEWSIRVPLTRMKIIEYLMKKFHQDLVFCRAPGIVISLLVSLVWPMPRCVVEANGPGFDYCRWLNALESPSAGCGGHERQVEKIDPLLQWVESQFGFKPIVYSSFFGGKQEDGLVNAIENLLKKTDDCELAAIDAIASAAHSLTIAIGIFRGKLQIEEAIELIRLEEDLQVDKWGLVEGGHDVDVADLKDEVESENNEMDAQGLAAKSTQEAHNQEYLPVKILRIYEKWEAAAGSNYIDPNMGKGNAASQKTRYCQQLQHSNVFDGGLAVQ